jgi:hypothetical protein
VPVTERVASCLRRLNDGDDIGGEDEGIGKVVWAYQDAVGKSEPLAPRPVQQFLLPYFVEEDGKSVLVPAVKGGGCVKIRAIKEEGETTRPAAKVLEAFGLEAGSTEIDLPFLAFEVITTPIRYFVEQMHL